MKEGKVKRRGWRILKDWPFKKIHKNWQKKWQNWEIDKIDKNIDKNWQKIDKKIWTTVNWQKSMVPRTFCWFGHFFVNSLSYRAPFPCSVRILTIRDGFTGWTKSPLEVGYRWIRYWIKNYVRIRFKYSVSIRKASPRLRASKRLSGSGKPIRPVVEFQAGKEVSWHPTLHKIPGRYSDHPDKLD